MKKFYMLMLFACYHITNASAQTWNTTGNSGTTNANFLGTTDNKDLIFKAKNKERGRLAAQGFWRFGTATNYAKIDSAGRLTFIGNAAYLVLGNKYVFRDSASQNRGLFYNSSVPQYEFRNSSANPVFYINADNGNGVFTGTLKVGAYTLPATDGTNGQVLTTNGAGAISWLTSAGVNTSLSNLAATTSVNVSLLPKTDSSLSLGSVSKSWKDIYLDGALYIDGTKFLADKAGTGSGNTLAGSHALYSNTSGGDNTALGYYAMYYNTTGGVNTAIGYEALYKNTTGSFNTATGYGALSANTEGNFNTAFGRSALFSNTIGGGNTALGEGALSSNTEGSYNIATGRSALFFNKTGSYNIAAGYESLFNNNTGDNNIATGYETLYSNTTGYRNIATGNKALYSNTTGYRNIATGYQTLYNNTVGSDNIALGHQALYSHISGSDNIALGYQALYHDVTGSGNIAMGNQSLYNNDQGIQNIAIGDSALYHNTKGYNNLAIGEQALYYNTQGFGNVAIGGGTLQYNTIGNGNSALGSGALFVNQTGVGNSAYGFGTLQYNSSGNSNSAYGESSLGFNTTGDNNTALGAGTLFYNETGNNNTALGADADVMKDKINNATAIGYNSVVDASNKVRIGNTQIISIGGQVGWTTFSDGRFKQSIKNNVQGLKFINLLNPITYTLDINALDNYYRKNERDSIRGKTKMQLQSSSDEAGNIIYNGFIAQDVEKAAQSLNYNFSGVDKPQTKDGLYGLRYSDFVVPLVKAVQELSKMNDNKDTKIAEQDKKIDAQQKQIDELRIIVLQIQQAQQQCSPCSGSTTSNAIQQNNITLTNTASLEQNIPNPFTNTTTIAYSLPSKFSSAKIIITDKNGKQLKQLMLSNAGKGTIHVDASTLASGAYNYALYVDGRLIASKQMERLK